MGPARDHRGPQRPVPRWLSSPPSGLTASLEAILTALRQRPHTLAELAERTGPAALTRPVIYHLIWARRITADLRQPLSQTTLLTRAPQPGEAA